MARRAAAILHVQLMAACIPGMRGLAAGEKRLRKNICEPGVSHDTAEFAVESILRWWQTLGRNTYHEATK
jgi:hypothetical protein